MKKSILVCVFLAACGGGAGGSNSSSYYQQRADAWQKSESACQTIETVCPSTGDFIWDLRGVLKQLPRIDYREDSGDQWASSCGTLHNGFGDCDDYATLTFRAITDSCLMDRYGISVGIRVVEGGHTDHVVTVVYFNGLDYIVDGLYVSDARSGAPVIYEY